MKDNDERMKGKAVKSDDFRVLSSVKYDYENETGRENVNKLSTKYQSITIWAGR